MKKNKNGLLVVIFSKDGDAIADWFELSRQNFDEAVLLIKYIRKKLRAYWWGYFKIFYLSRSVTLTQSCYTKGDYEGKLHDFFPSDGHPVLRDARF